MMNAFSLIPVECKEHISSTSCPFSSNYSSIVKLEYVWLLEYENYKVFVILVYNMNVYKRVRMSSRYIRSNISTPSKIE